MDQPVRKLIGEYDQGCGTTIKVYSFDTGDGEATEIVIQDGNTTLKLHGTGHLNHLSRFFYECQIRADWEAYRVDVANGNLEEVKSREYIEEWYNNQREFHGITYNVEP